MPKESFDSGEGKKTIVVTNKDLLNWLTKTQGALQAKAVEFGESYTEKSLSREDVALQAQFATRSLAAAFLASLDKETLNALEDNHMYNQGDLSKLPPEILNNPDIVWAYTYYNRNVTNSIASYIQDDLEYVGAKAPW